MPETIPKFEVVEIGYTPILAYFISLLLVLPWFT